jgi:diacylglycerol kinase family enzyme
MFVRARLPWVEIKVAQGLDINLDGEPLQVDKLRFTLRPKALRVHLPADSPLLGSPGLLNRPG